MSLIKVSSYKACSQYGHRFPLVLGVSPNSLSYLRTLISDHLPSSETVPLTIMSRKHDLHFSALEIVTVSGSKIEEKVGDDIQRRIEEDLTHALKRKWKRHKDNRRLGTETGKWVKKSNDVDDWLVKYVKEDFEDEPPENALVVHKAEVKAVTSDTQGEEKFTAEITIEVSKNTYKLSQMLIVSRIETPSLESPANSGQGESNMDQSSGSSIDNSSIPSIVFSMSPDIDTVSIPTRNRSLLYPGK